MTSSPMVRACITVLACALTCAVARAQSTVILENTFVRCTFDVPDQPGELLCKLVSIENLKLPGAAPLAFESSSGRWSVTLRKKHIPLGTYLTFFGDGSAVDIGSGTGSVTNLHVTQILYPANPLTGILEVRWEGTVTWDGTSRDFRVVVKWGFDVGQPQRPFAETLVRFTWLTGGGGPEYYVSEIRYPEVAVTEAAEPNDDALILPEYTGYLLRNPTDAGNAFPAWFDKYRNLTQPLHLAGYQNTDSQGRRNSFYFSESDGGDYWKGIEFTAAQDVGTDPGWLGFRMVHVPTNIYATTNFITPYTVQVGAITGDWREAAETYRTYLDEKWSWYEGPMASPANTAVPPTVKSLVAKTLEQNPVIGDAMDLQGRSALTNARVLGANTAMFNYGGWYPDFFDHFYFDGYLPGRPTFAAGMREAQKQFANKAMPYIQASQARDHSTVPGSVLTTLKQQIMDAFLWRENGQKHQGTTDDGQVYWVCSGDANWTNTIFPQNAWEIADFTDCKGLYLDYLVYEPCYRETHAHAPGGGNYLFHGPDGGPTMGRLDQLRILKDGLTQLNPVPSDFAIAMEGAVGRLTDEIHIMNLDGLGQVLLQDPLNPPSSPVGNAFTIPLFHAAFDNVKVSRIADAQLEDGKKAWWEAVQVFSYGGIPGLANSILEIQSSLAGRSNDGYLRYLSSITSALRDQGLMAWHNGTMRRLPALTVVPPSPAFTETPVLGTGYNKSYLELDATDEYVVPGMFQAPPDAVPAADADSLVYILTNPWVGADQQPITCSFSFDITAGYVGWPTASSYTVEEHLGGSTFTYLVPAGQGFTKTNISISPGEIAWWIFRK